MAFLVFTISNIASLWRDHYNSVFNSIVRDYPVVLNIDGACAPCAAISGQSDKNPSRTP